MPLVRTSARALFLALIPFAVIQGVLVSLSLWLWEPRPFLGLPGPDGPIVVFALQLAICGGLLFAGHVVLRHFGVYSRWAYGLMGGIAAALAYVTSARYGILPHSPSPGTWLTAGLMPTLAGALTGFLYGQFAGIEIDRSIDADTSGASLRGAFDGPVRVRTSLGAMVLTAFVPAILVAILAFSVVQIGGLGGGPKALFVALPAQIFLSTMFATAVPAMIFILIVHHMARALGFMRGLDYAGLGAGGGALFAVLAFPFSPIVAVVYLLIPSIAFGAIMGALYRRFAGLEPVPLPEPVVVTDEDSLIPVDDPARRSHTILLNG